jgi:uncharacterized pyridoxal phosphate-containing UPF0001 family protein
VGGEVQRTAPEDEVRPLLEAAGRLPHIVIEGLMTIPPFLPDPEAVRPYFRRLRTLRDKLAAEGFSLPDLSMGMTQDFDVAIEEGATFVRVGTGIFGERQKI